MTVIILTNCPAGLRGFLTRWLLEVSPASSSVPRQLAYAKPCGQKSASTQGRAVP